MVRPKKTSTGSILPHSSRYNLRSRTTQLRSEMQKNCKDANNRGHKIRTSAPRRTPSRRGGCSNHSVTSRNSDPQGGGEVSSPSSDNVECAICLDTKRWRSIFHLVTCAHSFHTKCFMSWLSRSGTCPVCRTPVMGSLDPSNPSNPRGDYLQCLMGNVLYMGRWWRRLSTRQKRRIMNSAPVDLTFPFGSFSLEIEG